MPIKDAVSTILSRNAFYRDGYRLLLRVTLIQTAVIGLIGHSDRGDDRDDEDAVGLFCDHFGWAHHQYRST